MAKQRILTVEDDPAIRRGIVDALVFAGYEVAEAGDRTAALRLACGRAFDLVLLDLVLPGGDGLDILREIRRIQPSQPVIILTARGDEDDRVRGLRLGADDYVVKPFSVRELLARVEAILRRAPERPREIDEIPIPGGSVCLGRGEAHFEDGTRCELSERELELLRYLASHSSRAVSRDELLRWVWQIEPRGISTRTIDMHVMRLREKLRDDPACPQIVLTVRGKGYQFAGQRGG